MGTGGETEASILLVAGPSGCGKSTLIGALRARRLAGGPLPEGAWAWPETCAKDIMHGDHVPAIQANAKGHRPKGLIVHYDTTRVLAYGFADHCDDPAIKFVASAEGPVLAVTVACPREMLFTQFLTRAVIRSDGMEPAQGSVARLKRGLRHLRHRAFGLPGISLSRMQVDRLAIYGSDRKFFQWTQRWETYLDRLAAARGDVHRLTAILTPGLDGAPSFTLSAAPAFQADKTNWRASA